MHKDLVSRTVIYLVKTYITLMCLGYLNNEAAEKLRWIYISKRSADSHSSYLLFIWFFDDVAQKTMKIDDIAKKTIKKWKKLIRKLSNMPFFWKPLHKCTHKYHRIMKIYIFWMMLVFIMKFGHFLANFGQKSLFLTVFWFIRVFFLKV